MVIVLAVITYAANCDDSNPEECWVDDPNDCPAVYQSVTCSPNDVCGYDGGTKCADTSAFSFGALQEVESTNPDSTYNVFDGGGLVDCYDYESTPSTPFCDNGGSYWCDYNSTCYGIERKTNCTDFGAGPCSFNCLTGYQYCTDIDTTGESNSATCSVDTDTSDCSALGAYSSEHTNVGAACACECDSGYKNCTALDTVGNTYDGCGADITGGGRDDCSIIGESSTNTWMNVTCGCQCEDGYGHCDGVETPDDTAPWTNGCEIKFDTVGSYVNTLDGSYTDDDNYVNTSCLVECSTNYLNCTGNNTIGNNYDGCGARVSGGGESTDLIFGWSGVNTNINTSCTSSCDTDYYNCDGDYTGTGCEKEDNSICSVGPLSGLYDGPACNCVVDKSYYETGTLANYSTTNPILWGHQYGTGWLINFTNSTNSTWGVTQSGCIYFPDTTEQCTAASAGGGADGWGFTSLQALYLYNSTSGVLTYDDTRLNNTNINISLIWSNLTKYEETVINVSLLWGNISQFILDTNDTVQLNLVKTNVSKMFTSNTTQANWITALINDNSTWKTSNTTQANNIDLLRTDNTTQAAEIDDLYTNVSQMWTNMTLYNNAYNMIITNQTSWFSANSTIEMVTAIQDSPTINLSGTLAVTGNVQLESNLTINGTGSQMIFYEDSGGNWIIEIT